MSRQVANYWKPIISHLSDETNGRTLCGIEIGRDWDCGGSSGDIEEAMCGCVRCMRVVEAARAAAPAHQGQGERGEGNG